MRTDIDYQLFKNHMQDKQQISGWYTKNEIGRIFKRLEDDKSMIESDKSDSLSYCPDAIVELKIDSSHKSKTWKCSIKILWQPKYAGMSFSFPRQFSSNFDISTQCHWKSVG